MTQSSSGTTGHRLRTCTKKSPGDSKRCKRKFRQGLIEGPGQFSELPPLTWGPSESYSDVHVTDGETKARRGEGPGQFLRPVWGRVWVGLHMNMQSAGWEGFLLGSQSMCAHTSVNMCIQVCMCREHRSLCVCAGL